MSLVSIIIPVFNEEDNLDLLFERLLQLRQSCPQDQFEYVVVDDGSTDRSRDIIRSAGLAHPEIKHIFFSRNFGHEMATTAGLDAARGDAVVIIDADLQDPPELVIEMLRKWREGFQVVYAQRRKRQGETLGKRLTAWAFYRLLTALSDFPIPTDTGDFRLMDRCVVSALRQCREQSRFVRGLVAWAGFRQIGILYDRDERHGGETKYNLWKLFRLALDAMIGFSEIPLRIALALGGLMSVVAFIVFVVVLVQKLVFGIDIPGYAMLATGLFSLGAIQLLVMGMMGAYIGRIYRQARQRPLYIVSEQTTPQQGTSKDASGPAACQ